MQMIDQEIIKAVGAFGGGVASSGRVCGILLGGVAMISTLYSRGSLAGKENPRLWSLSSRFTHAFEVLTKSFGSVDCCAIAGVDWQDRDQVKNYYNNPESSRKTCAVLVGESARLLGELLEEEAARQEG